MTNEKKNSSVYLRTTIALSLCMLFIFAIFSFTYYQRLSGFILSDSADRLSTLLSRTKYGLEVYLSDENLSSNKGEDFLFWYFRSVAVANECEIWVVDASGRLDYFTDIPTDAVAQLNKTSEHYYLTQIQMQELVIGSDVRVENATRRGLFIGPVNTWLTASAPIDGYDGYFVMHLPIAVQGQTMTMLANALSIPMITAFVSALILFAILTRSLLRPIRILSEVARCVSMGDLSARISIPELERGSSQANLFVTDELMEMVEAVNEMVERLETQESDRKIFVSSVAHDLRTPLTSIKGYLAAMLDGTIPCDEQEKYLKVVKGEVDRLETLILSINEASSLGDKKWLRMETFDLHVLIHQVLIRLQTLFQNKDIGVQLDLNKSPQAKLFVRADKEAMSRVIYNLLANAVKFTPDHGVVIVTTRMRDASTIDVRIEDSGPGIPEDKSKRVFDSFYKEDKSRNNPGSGLGLYICKEILNAHDQTIYAEKSEALGGAKIVFSLEAADRKKPT